MSLNSAQSCNKPMISRIAFLFCTIAVSLLAYALQAAGEEAVSRANPPESVIVQYDIYASALSLPARLSIGVADFSSNDLRQPSKSWPLGFDWIGTSGGSHRTHRFRIKGAAPGTQIAIVYSVLSDILPSRLAGEGQGAVKIHKRDSSQFRTEDLRTGYSGSATWRITALLTGGDGYIDIDTKTVGASPQGSIGIDSIKVYLTPDQASKDAITTLPVQTPVDTFILDEDGIIRGVRRPDGKSVINIALVGSQARIGEAFVGSLKGSASAPRVKSMIPGITDPYRIVALDWLESHARRLSSGAKLWSYDFDNSYNDLSMQAPWNSAFGQASVLNAFVTAFRDSHLPKYKELAVAAAKAFGIPVAEGGLYSVLGNDKFFEEVAIEPSRHILNAHISSTIALLKAGSELDDPNILHLGQEGVMTLKHHLWKYDLGYWSRYDLAPRSWQFLIRLLPHDAASAAGFQIDRIAVIRPDTGQSVGLDVGDANDSKGTLHISGTDWTETLLQDDLTVRSMVFGPDVRRAPAPGGSIQNTYVWLDLPDQKFDRFDGDENWLLRIDYFDAAPSRVAFQHRTADEAAFMKFQTLENGDISTTGSKEWRTAYIPIGSKNLAWYVGPSYQGFHIDLLRRLADVTGEAIFDVYARRWYDYLANHTSINAEMDDQSSAKAIEEPKASIAEKPATNAP